MNKSVMIVVSVLGLIAIVSLIALSCKLISERYVTLRNIGVFQPIFGNKDKSVVRHKPIHKKFLRHKYSRGTAYDRAKLRTNRFQKNYV